MKTKVQNLRSALIQTRNKYEQIFEADGAILETKKIHFIDVKEREVLVECPVFSEVPSKTRSKRFFFVLHL